MSKAKNWIIGAGAVYVLIQVFGKDEPKAPIPPKETTVTQSAPSTLPSPVQPPLGLVQVPSSPRQPNQPAPVSNPHPFIGKWVFAKSRVNMRTQPSTSSGIITTIDRGARVRVLNRRQGWFSVEYQHRTGWVSEALLSEDPPRAPSKPVSTPRITTPSAVARTAPARRPGQPVRSPYVGTCDCPYDRMRNGRICGRTSAYSRPGGREPVCYY